MRTSDYASAHQLLCNGAGIGPLPDLIARQSLARGELVPILADWQVATGTLLRNHSQRRSGPRQGAVVPRVSAQRADNPAATDLTAGAIAITLATAALPTPEPDATCRLN